MAKRYLVAKKSHNAVNIISWISILSIAIGSFALVVVLSAFNGLEDLVESLFESFESDIRIEAKSKKVFSASEIDFNTLKELEGVANYTKVLEEVCGVKFQNNHTIASIKGVEDTFLSMSELDSTIIEGEAKLKTGNINFGIFGYGIASELGIYLRKPNESISIYSPKRGKINPIMPMNSVYKKGIEVGGIFYISPEYDTKYIVVPLSFAQELLRYEDEISSIEIKAQESVSLEELKSTIENYLGESYIVKSRYEFNDIIYKTNKTEKWVTFLILLFILIIAAFNILGSLTMLILEKKSNIKTLYNIGVNFNQIKRIFFYEGMLINLTGGLSGIILGIFVCLMQQEFGLLRLEGGIVEFYPVKINPVEIIYILVTVLVIGFISSWIPIQRLSRKTI